MSLEESKTTILIVGDWVVDEYWFLVRHRSDVASHTGFAHYRLSSEPNDLVFDLCGAGLVARLLYELCGENPGYKLVGVGLWDSRDTRYLKHLIHSRMQVRDTLEIRCPVAKAAFSLEPQTCEDPPDIELVTLDPNSPTIRVIRSYHEGASGLEQINRVDWVPGMPASPNVSWERMDKASLQAVSAIVVYDRGKGAVTKEVISYLREHCPSARWYVKGKEVSPGWLKELRDCLSLMVIGPEVASLFNPWDRWLIRDRINLTALEMIDGDRLSENTVLLSDRCQVIARARSSQGCKHRLSDGCPEKCSKECPRRCFTAHPGVLNAPFAQLGWSSAFFAALVFRMIGETGERRSELDQGAIEFALEKANRHATTPVPYRSALRTIQRVADLAKAAVVPSNWEVQKNEWDQATDELGVIHDGEEHRLEVWRGSTQIPGYVACIKRKKEIIDEIGHKLRAFSHNRSGTHKSLSILLLADPGSGKTFLARSLAKALGFYFLGYDITQMVHREELLDIFDMVATKQAESSTPLLVFVDEINALLDGNQVYGAFLLPIEEGIYLRRGNAFKLQPCVWIFAATGLGEGGAAFTEKYRDIVSRMTMIRDIGYKSLRPNRDEELTVFENQAKLERVYLAAMIMRRMYSDIQMVSYEVLERFRNENPAESSPRAIANRVAELRNVQYGQVTRRNCESWKGWPRSEDRRMVRLVFE